MHLTLSRAGLLGSFKHYLDYGSEFDQRVAEELFGDDGLQLLASDGAAVLCKFAVPGRSALKAAHPFFGIDSRIGQDDLPNVVNEFLKTMSYFVYDPSLVAENLMIDCGLTFFEVVPKTWILEVKRLND